MNTKRHENKQDEQILIADAEQYYQLQVKNEQLKQEQKPCFSLTDLVLVALGISFFD